MQIELGQACIGKAQLLCGPVVAQVQCVAGLRYRHRHHTGLVQQPGQRYLGRRGAVAFGHREQKRVVDEFTLVERAVGHQRHLLQPLPGQQGLLHAALAERGVHLIGGARVATGHGGQFAHVIGVEIAHAPQADEAAALQLLETAHRLGQRHSAAPRQCNR